MGNRAGFNPRALTSPDRFPELVMALPDVSIRGLLRALTGISGITGLVYIVSIRGLLRALTQARREGHLFLDVSIRGLLRALTLSLIHSELL